MLAIALSPKNKLGFMDRSTKSGFTYSLWVGQWQQSTMDMVISWLLNALFNQD